MIKLSVPGIGELALEHIVCDVNGTLAVDGVLEDGVAERLKELEQHLAIHLLTADTHRGQAAIDYQLGLTASRLERGKEKEQKAAFVRKLGADTTVAMGNGGNDAGMLEAAAIGIAVIGGEGLNVEALQAADAVVRSVEEGLDLLLKPKRLLATLRR